MSAACSCSLGPASRCLLSWQAPHSPRLAVSGRFRSSTFVLQAFCEPECMEALISIPADSDFPLANLPYGVFCPASGGKARVCVALGDQVVDLARLAQAGCFSGPILSRSDCFEQPSLNAFMGLGRTAWKEARSTLTRLLSNQEGQLRDNAALRAEAIIPMADVSMQLPAQFGDYTDFYASRHHAFNMGCMFRGPDNALQPNWVHLPVGYHGRASSIVPSGINVHRPRGQILPSGSSNPAFAPSAAVDYELEVAAVMGPGNDLGVSIPVDTAAVEHIFGLVLMNDWSARDIQKWEYVPLGPFNSKNWATQVSPWVVTLDALEPYRCAAPAQDPAPLPHLQESKRCTYDVNLTVGVQPAGKQWEGTLATSNLKHLYWTFPQMVAHHTSGGCNLRPGDLLGSGTISGPEPSSRGCLQEATWGGRDPMQLRPNTSISGNTGAAASSGEQQQDSSVQEDGAKGVQRVYLEDGDEVVMRGWCQREGHPRIGFGECRGKLLPPKAIPHNS